MASNVSSQVQAEAKKLIENRSRIWDQYDEAQGQVSELYKYRDRFSAPNSPSVSPQDFDTNNLPPAGVAAAVWKLKQKDGDIRLLQQKIQRYEEDLKKNDSQFLMVAVGAVMVAIVVFFMLFGMITS